MNNKAIIMVVAAFVLAIGAGALLGVTWSRLHPPQPLPVEVPTPTSPSRPSLQQELGLTPDQTDQMRKIWMSVAPSGGRNGGPGPGPGQNDPVRELQKKRDDAVKALIPMEKQDAYTKILADFQHDRDEINHQRQLRIDEAERKTEAVLTSDQLAKYHQIQSRRGGRGGDLGRPDGGRGEGRRGGPRTRPTSQPATQAASQPATQPGA